MPDKADQLKGLRKLTINNLRPSSREISRLYLASWDVAVSTDLVPLGTDRLVSNPIRWPYTLPTHNVSLGGPFG